MTFNPSAPCAIGNEWRVTRETSLAVKADADLIIERLRSTNARTINYIWVWLSQAQALEANGGTGFELEIYEDGNLGSTALVTDQFRPLGDVRNFMGGVAGAKAFAWGPFAPGGTTTDIYRGIEGVSLTPALWPNSVPLDPQPVDNDRFIYPLFGEGYDVAFHVDGLAGTFAGQRITRVITKAIVGFYIWSSLINGMGIKPYLMTNGQQDFRTYPQTIRAGVGGGTLVEASWSYNPATRGSWKIGELGLFDAANANPYYAMGWQVSPTGSANNLATILQAWMEIETTDEATDARVATALMSTATAAGFAPAKVGWNRVPVFSQPDHQFGWDKDAIDYVVSLRRTAGGGLVAWRLLASDHQQAPHVWDNAFAQVAPPAQVLVNYQLLTDRIQFSGTNYPILLEDDGGDIDPDSQPYASGMGDLEPSLSVNNDWVPVNSGNEVQQDITAVATDSYGFVRFVARLDGLDADAPLLVSVRRRSDDVLMGGGPATILPADVPAPRDQYQEVEGRLLGIAAPLVAATQYYLAFTSAATPGTGWRVQVLSTYLVGTMSGPPANVGDATFDGTTDVAHINGTPHDELDVAGAIYTSPEPPASFDAVIDGVDPYSWVVLEWEPTDVAAEGCGDFMRYEIERSDDGGATYDKRWQITDESADHVLDVEVLRSKAPVDKPMRYRMRVRRADHSTSDWTADTITVDTDHCGYWFGSNEWGDDAPTMLRWADDIGPERASAYAEPQASRQTFVGRDYGVTFRGLERDGVQFDRELFLAGIGATDGTPVAADPGEAVFLDFMAAVVPSLGATLSYVAVASSDGELWLAAVTVNGDTFRHEPDGSYHLTVHISQETTTPSLVDALGTVIS